MEINYYHNVAAALDPPLDTEHLGLKEAIISKTFNSCIALIYGIALKFLLKLQCYYFSTELNVLSPLDWLLQQPNTSHTSVRNTCWLF